MGEVGDASDDGNATDDQQNVRNLRQQESQEFLHTVMTSGVV